MGHQHRGGVVVPRRHQHRGGVVVAAWRGRTHTRGGSPLDAGGCGGGVVQGAPPAGRHTPCHVRRPLWPPSCQLPSVWAEVVPFRKRGGGEKGGRGGGATPPPNGPDPRLW